MEDTRVMKKQPKKHLWKPEEDLILKKYVETHGEGNWAIVSQQSGLMRGGKSCRLRWKNYLRPNIKRGDMSKEEEDLIIRMHKLLGNRWSLIAGRIPGRTDNEVKNYWNTHLNRRFKRVKRKQINTSESQNDSHISKIKSKESKTDTIVGESHKGTEDRVEERKEEESNSLLNPAKAAEARSFNYNVESPIIAGHGSMFVFEDEPLITYMDSFLFFEAFGCNAAGENYAEIGMKSVVP